MIREPAPEPAFPPVEQEEREPDDDRGEGERKVDEGVQQALAAELLAHDREAQTIPNTVFTGTAMAVMIKASLNALMVSGVVSASQAGAKPSSNVRQKTIASGPTRITAR